MPGLSLQLGLGLSRRGYGSGAGGGASNIRYIIPIYGQSLALGAQADEIVSLETGTSITGATQADPVVVTAAGHGLSNGDTVYIDGVSGMTQLNIRTFEVTVSGNDVSLYTHDGEVPSVTTEDGTGHTAYTSGGTIYKCSTSTTHKMFNGGIRILTDDPDKISDNSFLYADTAEAMIDLHERTEPTSGASYAETVAYGLGQKITDKAFFFSTARGSSEIIDLSRNDTQGYLHYFNNVAGVQYANDLITAAGETSAVPVTVFLQGEQDAVVNTGKANYKTRLENLRSDLEKSYFHALGNVAATNHPILSVQQAMQWSGQDYASIAVAVIEKHRDSATLFPCAGPAYWTDDYKAVNDVHLNGDGYRIRGEWLGRIVQHIIDGGTWNPCHITAVSRTTTTITVTVHVPSGNLVEDTTIVASVADKGFTYSGANITSVVIGSTSSNSCDITITIDADAGGTLGYAYENGTNQRIGTLYGPRGNIRDSETATTEHDSSSLYNWLCVDQWTVA